MAQLKYWDVTANAFLPVTIGSVGPQGPPGPAGVLGPAGGDLSGTYPNPSVVKVQGTPIYNLPPTANQILQYNTVLGAWVPTNLPSTLPPSGPAGGDLNGSYPNPTVRFTSQLPAGRQAMSGTVNIAGGAFAQYGFAGTAVYKNGFVLGLGNSLVVPVSGWYQLICKIRLTGPIAANDWMEITAGQVVSGTATRLALPEGVIGAGAWAVDMCDTLQCNAGTGFNVWIATGGGSYSVSTSVSYIAMNYICA